MRDAIPTFGDKRTAADGGLAGDTLKCQLKPLDFASYPVTFTPAQQTRLQATFPTGVCDWSKPGVARTAMLLGGGPAGPPPMFGADGDPATLPQHWQPLLHASLPYL